MKPFGSSRINRLPRWLIAATFLGFLGFGSVLPGLAPHVRTYTSRRLLELLDGLPVEVVEHRRIYGGYDNLVARLGTAGRALRAAVQGAEGSPLQVLGLSHLLVVQRIA